MPVKSSHVQWVCWCVHQVSIILINCHSLIRRLALASVLGPFGVHCSTFLYIYNSPKIWAKMIKYNSKFLESCLSYVRTRYLQQNPLFLWLIQLHSLPFSTRPILRELALVNFWACAVHISRGLWAISFGLLAYDTVTCCSNFKVCPLFALLLLLLHFYSKYLM